MATTSSPGLVAALFAGERLLETYFSDIGAKAVAILDNPEHPDTFRVDQVSPSGTIASYIVYVTASYHHPPHDLDAPVSCSPCITIVRCEAGADDDAGADIQKLQTTELALGNARSDANSGTISPLNPIPAGSSISMLPDEGVMIRQSPEGPTILVASEGIRVWSTENALGILMVAASVDRILTDTAVPILHDLSIRQMAPSPLAYC